MRNIQKLLAFEKETLDLKLKFDEHIKYLYRELTFDTESQTVTYEEFSDMLDRVDAEVMRMEKTLNERLGQLLLRAVEISRAALEENVNQ